MNIEINGLNINYETEGSGMPMVFLHGWGGSTKSFQFLYDYYKTNFQVINLDLPGFGQSDEPKEAWDVGDYSDFIVAFYKALKIVKPIVVAHSFGCRVTIKSAGKMSYHKLVMTGAAGIKPKRSINYYIKVYSYKLMKNIAKLPGFKQLLGPKVSAYRNKAGSSDYNDASEIMKSVLVKSVNEDLRAYLPKLKASTLLIWGENDTATPLSNGQLMEKMIPDAGLVVLDGGTHFAYLEQAGRFKAILDAFVEGDKHVAK